MISANANELTGNKLFPFLYGLAYYSFPLLCLVPLALLLYKIIAWRLFQASTSKAVRTYLIDAAGLLRVGLSKVRRLLVSPEYNLMSNSHFPLTLGFLQSFQSDSFQFLSDNGYKTILSPKYTSEISRHPSLNFGEALASENHFHIRGFDPFRQFTAAGHAFQNAVRTELTRALGE